MIMQVTDCTCGMLALRTRRPFPVDAAQNSCSHPLTPVFGDRDRLAGAVVVTDEDAPGLGDDLAADAEDVVEIEALLAEAARVHGDLDLAAGADRSAEVDLYAGHDDGH